MGRKPRPAMSEYASVWLIAMFDLPVKERDERREYRQFHDLLVSEGFLRLQFSVYARYFQSEEASEARRRRLCVSLPPGGQVRLLSVTDHQFGKMEVFHGKLRAEPERRPEQLSLF
ncbi:MAG: CRISPR-associated endonuclease Cas2 [Acidobacteria bacterium]|nr:MAG: CRISPR-associated endonuclease Cas2 [Acidobacteriota bacterium]